MPTKTYKRVSDQRAHPFRPNETELFPMGVCGQMAGALGINGSGEIARLHRILNDAGSFAHLAAYVKKEGVPAANQRTALKGLKKLLEQVIKFIDELDWQSNEDIAAGYAKDGPVFTASADRISSEAYSQRDRDVAAIRRLALAVEFSNVNLNTSGKSRLGIEIRQAKHLMEVYEEFTRKRVSGERSPKSGNLVRQFLELGLNHITGGALAIGQIDYVLRKAAEMLRQQEKMTYGVNYPSARG
jgi:hypothetical protein